MSDYFGTLPSSFPEPPSEGGSRWHYKRGELHGTPLAGWHLRVTAALIDFLACIYLPGRLLPAFEAPVSFVALMQLSLVILNCCIYQGGNGQSLGKHVLGIQLARPVMRRSGKWFVEPGVGRCLFRLLAHVLDVPFLPLSIGGLRPIWNPLRQTFADSAAHTVVLRRPVLLEPPQRGDDNLV